MLSARFGIEIEFTGITRKEAAYTAAEYLGGFVSYEGTSYDTYAVVTPDERRWRFMRDGSIKTEKKVNGARQRAGSDTYSVELVSPILTYAADIEKLQGLIRKLREKGGFANNSCGIHIHLDGADHTARSIKNFIRIIASKNDLFYKALEIKPERMHYCQKMDETLVRSLRNGKGRTLRELEEIWYRGYTANRRLHYHASRYHFLNLHSFFNGHHTVELRGFNSTLHAGKVRSYIVLALALNHQALTQKCASAKKPQTDNEKFAMRTYLNRLGLIGDEFANCREHLTKALDGNGAWRFGTPA